MPVTVSSSIVLGVKKELVETTSDSFKIKEALSEKIVHAKRLQMIYQLG